VAKSVHDGHRERVRAEFRDGNFNEKTPPHKVLEALLFYSIPRGDTNVIAHELINKFGGIDEVLQAGVKELMAVKGVGEATATYLKIIGVAVKSSYETHHKQIKRYNNLEEVCKMIMQKYYAINYEMVSATCFKADGTFSGFHVIGEGDISKVGISLRTLFEVVIESKAASVVLAHNHPTGKAVPSPEDLEATKQIRKALSDIGVVLIDHIIIDRDDYVSLKSSHQFAYLFE